MNLQTKVVSATKWSFVTEIAAKIVTPVTSMILARLLTPDAFGVVVTVNMILSFADMLADAGFQKYLVQREFDSDAQRGEAANVAFWTNLALALVLWGGISLGREPLAALVGSPGLGGVIMASCVLLPINSFSGIQVALQKRSFQFKWLFAARMISAGIPLVVTVPLALLGWRHWSIIAGMVCGQAANAVLLNIVSAWKPSFFFRFRILKQMLSFSLWTMLESVAIWFSTWTDALLIGGALSSHYLGLYKTSLNLVNSLISIFTVSVTPVLFSALCRLQRDDAGFRSAFYRTQEVAAYVLFPVGLCLYLYSDVVTAVMLGAQWGQAGFIIGIWGLTSAAKVVLCDFNSECFRARGRPRLSFLIQLTHLMFLVPACVISLRYGFEALVYTRAFVRFQLVLSSMLVMHFVLRIGLGGTFRRIWKPLLLTVMTGAAALLLRRLGAGLLWGIGSIAACGALYAALLFLFARREVLWMLRSFTARQKTTKRVVPAESPEASGQI